jgi:H+/Cl- antiporter ClcA/PII-like signaling protein
LPGLRSISDSEPVGLLRYLVRWIPVAVLAGLLGGTASAVLLWSLVIATETREAHKWLIALLPVAGLAVGMMYLYFGTAVEAGNNLILDEIHDPKRTIPIRMTPLILLGTFLTHLFGGSAGREGTAIQTGASLADQLAKPFRMNARERRILLMAGISAGFASVFGTPLAGAVFGIEVLAFGAVSYDALTPCFLAAFIGNFTTEAWGNLTHVHHTIYRVAEVPPLHLKGILLASIAGAAFGLVGMGFANATHGVAHFFKKHISWPPLRPFLGGTAVALAVFATHSTKFIGLGIPTIVAAFHGQQPPYDFAAKFVFTVVTLGAGFKGGEVTPLFFIGATLGNALSYVLPLPPSLLAGMGFVAVFAGAANTPIASTFMAMELFGAEAGAYAAIACVVSYLFSGHAGIYRSQRVGSAKHVHLAGEEGLSLALIAKLRDMPELGVGAHEVGQQIFGGELMEDLTVLRLYFSAHQMRSADSWWKRLAPQSLGEFLLREAKVAGIEQALLHRVIGGYLKDHNLAMDTGEIAPARLPQCLELVGPEESLNRFLDLNREHLKKVRTVFLRGEEARYEAKLETDELREAFAIERKDTRKK